MHTPRVDPPSIRPALAAWLTLALLAACAGWADERTIAAPEPEIAAPAPAPTPVPEIPDAPEPPRTARRPAWSPAD